MWKKLLFAAWLIGNIYFSNAQQSVNDQHPDITYTRALDLFDKQKYAGAIREFEHYKQSASDVNLKTDATYYIAVCRIRLGHENGVDLLESFIEEYPGSAKINNANKELADYWFLKENYKKALSHYKQVDVSTFPGNETDAILFNRGYCQFQTGKYEDAKNSFYPLTLRQTPYYIRATYYHGYVCYMSNDYDNALASFLKIEEQGPQTLKLYICQIYYLKGDFKQAIAYADKVNLGKLEKQKAFIKAKAYYRLNDFKSAKDNFDNSHYNVDSLSDEELYEIGYTYFKTGNCSRTFTVFEKIAPKGTAIAQMASYHLGECFLKEDKKQNAFNAFFEAQRTDFDAQIKENAMFNYSLLAYELNDYRKAINGFQKFILSFPYSPRHNEAKKHLASLFVVTDDPQTAIPILETITDMDAETKELYQRLTYNRGEELFMNKDWNGAIKMFNKAISIKSSAHINGLSNFWLAEISYANQRYSDARNMYQKFIESEKAPESELYPNAFYGIAYCLFKSNQYSEAAVYFKKYQDLLSKYKQDENRITDASLRLGDCYFMVKNYPSAVDAYSYVTSRNAAGSDYALYQQAMIFGLQNKPMNKINTLKRISREFPNSSFVQHAIFQTASEWMQLENFAEAERNFRYLIEDYPNSMYISQSQFSLGLIYDNQGRDREAYEQYKYIVMNHQGTAESKLALKNVERIAISLGITKEYFDWLGTVPNATMDITYKDSVTFASALKVYMSGNCDATNQKMQDYLNEYPRGYYSIAASYYIGECALATNNKEKAAEHYKKVAESNPSQYKEDATRKLSDYYYETNDCLNAIKYYKILESIAVEKENIQIAVLRQMHCAYKINDFVLAKKQAERALTFDNISKQERGASLNYLGKIALNDSLYDQALSYFQRTLQSNQDVAAAEAKYYEAFIYYSKDSLETSKKKVFEFNQQFSSHDLWLGKVFILLSDIYVKKGDHFQAKATLNSVIENFDTPEIIAEAKEKLAKLKAMGK